MKQTVVSVLALAGAVALLTGAFLLWRQRPWRIAVSVNGRVLSAGELAQRAQTMLDDAKRHQMLIVPKGRENEALRHYAREAAKAWIVKEVMLSEALQRGYEPTAEDEVEARKSAERRLRSRNMTLEEFFTTGPLPEAIKRKDFREGMLIQRFVAVEVRDKIVLTPQEITEKQQELKRIAVARAKPGEKPDMTWDRKTAMELLRNERFSAGFRKLFRTLYGRAAVKCPEFPDLETLNGVSPARPEDSEDEADAPAAASSGNAAPPPAGKPEDGAKS